MDNILVKNITQLFPVFLRFSSFRRQWESDAISTPGEIQDNIDMDENAAAALAEEREDVSTISDSSESEAEDVWEA
ncbi:hypothetical protein QE152_g40024 [Popillia japonica]|uniref:Uncharacterized protein n=1 Tax=Popillia japonica TaxID=7064 RepID=A0AAW1HSS6_POPJA